MHSAPLCTAYNTPAWTLYLPQLNSIKYRTQEVTPALYDHDLCLENLYIKIAQSRKKQMQNILRSHLYTDYNIANKEDEMQGQDYILQTE